MRKIFTLWDIEELLDHVIGVAMMTHESGIETAIKLELPEDIIMVLRIRANRAANTTPCNCPECNEQLTIKRKVN